MAFAVSKIDPSVLRTDRVVKIRCSGELFEGTLKGSAFQLLSVQGQTFAEVGDYQWYIFDNFALLDKLSRTVKRRYRVSHITIGEYQINYQSVAKHWLSWSALRTRWLNANTRKRELLWSGVLGTVLLVSSTLRVFGIIN